MHKVFVMPGLRLAIYHLHFSEQTPTHRARNKSVPYTLREMGGSWSKGGIAQVRDSRQNLLASPSASPELSSNLNSDKALVLQLIQGLPVVAGEAKTAAVFSEINAKSPLNYTSANQLIIFFSLLSLLLIPGVATSALPNPLTLGSLTHSLSLSLSLSLSVSTPAHPPSSSVARFLPSFILLALNLTERIECVRLVQFLGRYSCPLSS